MLEWVLEEDKSECVCVDISVVKEGTCPRSLNRVGGGHGTRLAPYAAAVVIAAVVIAAVVIAAYMACVVNLADALVISTIVVSVDEFSFFH